MAFNVDVSMSAKAWKVWEIITWSLLVLLIVATVISNWFMPRGHFVDTGDVNCPDYGQCTEQYYEDTSNINIPTWARDLRNNGEIIPFFALLVLGWYLNYKRKEQENSESYLKEHHKHLENK